MSEKEEETPSRDYKKIADDVIGSVADVVALVASPASLWLMILIGATSDKGGFQGYVSNPLPEPVTVSSSDSGQTAPSGAVSTPFGTFPSQAALNDYLAKLKSSNPGIVLAPVMYGQMAAATPAQPATAAKGLPSNIPSNAVQISKNVWAVYEKYDTIYYHHWEGQTRAIKVSNKDFDAGAFIRRQLGV